MKIEFSEEGYAKCPHVRIYDFDNIEARQLRELFIELAEGENSWTSLDKIDNVEMIDGCDVKMRVGAWDRGLRNFSGVNKFEWILTEDSWKNMAKIAEAFCDEDRTEMKEWLEQKKGDIPVLIECEG